jgi:osmotically-inducible protein OsmY
MRQPSDAELARALAEALGAHSAVRSGRVQAGVQEHWVSLQGSATDGEWSEIERIALSVEGVSGVRLSHCDSRRRGAKRH